MLHSGEQRGCLRLEFAKKKKPSRARCNSQESQEVFLSAKPNLKKKKRKAKQKKKKKHCGSPRPARGGSGGGRRLHHPLPAPGRAGKAAGPAAFPSRSPARRGNLPGLPHTRDRGWRPSDRASAPPEQSSPPPGKTRGPSPQPPRPAAAFLPGRRREAFPPRPGLTG